MIEQRNELTNKKQQEGTVTTESTTKKYAMLDCV